MTDLFLLLFFGKAGAFHQRELENMDLPLRKEVLRKNFIKI